MFAVPFTNATTIIGPLPPQIVDTYEKEATWLYHSREAGRSSDIHS